MPKFAVNLSFLWTELPLLERIGAARDAGFAAVEYMSPYELRRARFALALDTAGLQQALFNLPAGDWAAGDRGTASDPEPGSGVQGGRGSGAGVRRGARLSAVQLPGRAAPGGGHAPAAVADARRERPLGRRARGPAGGC